MSLGMIAGGFFKGFNAAQQRKEEREQQEKENKARTQLFEIQLRRAQQEEQAQRQQQLARESFFADARTFSSPQNMEPMSLTAMLADPQMGLKALQGGLVNVGDLAGPKEPESIARLRALMENPDLMAAEERLRRAGASSVTVDTGMNKPPPGYIRPDPNKPGLQIEPGGPAAREIEEANAKKRASAESATSQGLSVTTTIDDALKLATPMTTGVASEFSNIKGTKAYDLAQQLATIKANLGFDKLQEMRANSPTGGALGAVAVAELTALQAAIASLDQGQSFGQLKKNLGKIKDHYEKWQDTVRKAGVMDESGAMGGVVDFNSLPE